MKQTLKILTSLVLSASFMLSSLAAPVMVGTVENAAEGVAEQTQTGMADLAADVVIKDTEETVIKEVSFDNDAEGWKFIAETWTHDGGTAGGQSYVGGLDGDGAYYIESVIEHKTDTITNADGSTSKKNYGIDLRVANTNLKGLNLNTEDITKIEVRVKNTVGKSQSLKMYWITENYPISEARTMSQNYDGSDWTVVTFDVTGLTADNGWVDTLTGIRFKLGTAAANTYSIDYIKFYGYKTTVHEWLPGYNLLTGTKQPVTFDAAPYTGSKINGTKFNDDNGNYLLEKGGYFNSMSVEAPVSGSDNKALMLTDLTYYGALTSTNVTSFPSVKYLNLAVPEDGRPVFMSLNAMITDTDSCVTTSTSEHSFGLRFSPNSDTNASSTDGLPPTSNYKVNNYKSTDTNRTFTKLFYKDMSFGAEKPATTHAIPLFNIQVPVSSMEGIPEENKAGWKLAETSTCAKAYIDDLFITPYYKVTYMNGTTELGSVYVLDDGNGNLLESFDPNDYDDELTLPETINAWSLTNGGEATHNITLNNEDIVVYGVYETNFTPGYNMLTGTADPLTFDNLANGTHTGGKLVDADGNVVLSYDNGTIQTKNINVIDTPVAGETGKALEFSGYGYNASNTCYPKLKFYNYEAPSDGRPVLIKLDAFSKKLYDESTTKLTSSATAIYPLYNGGGNGVVSIKLYDYNVAPAWVHGFHKDEKSGANGLATIQFSAALTADGFAKATEEEVDIVHHFVDNVGFYPYYKVTYMNGATEIDSVYVLDDGKGNFLSQIDPNAYGVELPEGKLGWSLTDNGEPTDAVQLENEDIILYATEKLLAFDNTILSFEFNDEKSLEDWSFPRAKDGKAAIKDGNLVFTAVHDGSWDTSMNNQKIRFTVDDVKTVEMRFKIVDETGETPAVVDMSKYKCDIHYRLDVTSGWTNNYIGKKYSAFTPDEEGYYTLTWTSDELAVTDWDGEMNLLRFDPHDSLPMEATAYVDYIRFYGDPAEEFAAAPYAPEKREGVSLKVESEETTGVRFKAAMSNTARADSALTEYGWLVALAPTLGREELTHGFESTNGKMSYKEGIAYDTAKNIDKIFDNTSEPDYTIFTALIVGIPSDKADIEVVIRPFSRASGGAYLYGESRVISPRAVGQKIYDDYMAKGCPEGHDYVTYQAFIDSLGITK